MRGQLKSPLDLFSNDDWSLPCLLPLSLRLQYTQTRVRTALVPRRLCYFLFQLLKPWDILHRTMHVPAHLLPRFALSALFFFFGYLPIFSLPVSRPAYSNMGTIKIYKVRFANLFSTRSSSLPLTSSCYDCCRRQNHPTLRINYCSISQTYPLCLRDIKSSTSFPDHQSLIRLIRVCCIR